MYASIDCYNQLNILFFRNFVKILILLKVLIFAPAPLSVSPSQRFRYEHYILDTAFPCDCTFTHHAFFTEKAWAVLFKQKHLFRKTMGIVSGFLRTISMMFRVKQFDAVYVHRGITPIGPPVFEWMIARVFRKKLIFDFDDAIWVRTASAANPLAVWLKWNSKVKHICSYSTIVTVGNTYLASYAQKYNKDVRIIPTVVNTDNYHNKIKDHRQALPVIGWTGTFTNFSSLETILPVIKRLQEKYPVSFEIIAEKNPNFSNITYRFIPWKRESEIADLLSFSIGVMPLEQKEMDKGKCAFKAIQYMSLGIPTVLSPIGANTSLVNDGEDGFFATDEQSWYNCLEKLILNTDLRIEVGEKARTRIVNDYSVKSSREAFCNLFKD